MTQRMTQRMTRRMNRRGVALIVVLWVLATAGVVVATGLATARGGIATSSYRLAALQARWAADACLSFGRARMEAGLHDGRVELWQEIDALPAALDTIRLAPGIACVLETEPSDTVRVDLNSAPPSLLRSLPGFDAEVIATLLQIRRIEALNDLLTRLTPTKRDSLMSHYSELVWRIQFQPSRVRAVGVGLIDQRVIEAVAEEWVRANTRVAIVDRELL